MFRAVFEEVVRRCAEAGLVPGDGVAADGSQVEACASRHKRLPGRSTPEAWAEDRGAQTRLVREYLEALAAARRPSLTRRNMTPRSTSRRPIPRQPGASSMAPACLPTRPTCWSTPPYGVIVDVDATPARLSQEIVAAKVMLTRAEATFGFRPDCLGADKSYGTGSFLTWLLARGTVLHIPVLDRTAQTDGMCTRESFTYEEANDVWHCPADHRLVGQASSAARECRGICRGRETAAPVR